MMEEKNFSECPICGAEVEEGATECPDCGEPLGEEKELECPICGAEAEEGATECPECGQPLGEEEEELECPICGAEVEESATKCPECGEPLKEDELNEFIEELEEFKRSISEGPKTIFRKPRKVIKEYRKDIEDILPLFSSFLIPIFLMTFVGLEFIITLLGYPIVYPARSVYYLTPLPFFESSWISSLTLSFVVSVCLFVTSWRGYRFRSESGVDISKYMISLSVVFSVIISASIILHIYYSQGYSGIVLTFFLLALILFLLITQLELLRKKETVFPRVEEKKICPNCNERMSLDIERCPNCDTGIGGAVTKEQPEEDKGIVEEELAEIEEEESKEKSGKEEEESWTELEEALELDEEES